MSRFIILLLINSFLLTGCVKQEILDKLSLFIVCSFDEAPNNQMELTLVVPMFQAGKPGSVSNMLHSKMGHTVKNIEELMEMRLNQPINPGKLSVVLYGKEKAEKGIANELDVAFRNAQVSRRMYMAVVDGKAKEMLQANFSSEEEKGIFLVKLLHENVKNGLTPRQNLHTFHYAYLGKGMDPFLPLLKLQNNQVVISGLALFKDDKYVMSLNEKQMHLIKLLLEKVKKGTLEVTLDNGSYVAINNVGSKASYRFNKGMNQPEVTIDLVLNGEIIESRGITNPKQEQQLIKERFENDLTTTGMDLIQMFKNEGIDPLGLGDFVRSKTRNWNEDEWKEQYRTMNVQLNVKVNITEMGITK